MKNLYTILAASVLISTSAVAQNIGINATGAAPAASAMLDVSATNKGVLIPRVALTSTADVATIASPATSLLIYNTATAGTGSTAVYPGYYYWDGSKWVALGGTGGKDWSLLGNAGTTAGTNFLGTTDAQALVFKTNNTERARFLSTGELCVNATALLATEKLHIEGGTGYAIRARNSSASDVLWVQNLSNGRGVHGSAYGTGDGVYGYSTSGNGVRGIGNGAGVFGGRFFNGNASGTGLLAIGNNLTGSFLGGGTGIAATGNDGIFAYGNTTTGTGVIGVGNNQANIFVFPNGGGGSFTGDYNGVTGYAETTSSSSYAVYGQYDGGVANGTGVYGWAYPSAGWGYGVYGYGGWYGVYANGDLGASGFKTFLIDDPVDPENKFLRHFSIESNEVLNVYRGNVVLDNNGQAVVQLPDYFHLININFSYNLTPIGAPAQLYILKEINENGQFVIAGGQPGQKVSWYVYAERNDPYAKQYPEKKKVIVEKTGERKGKYLMPELYGQPDEKGYDSKKGNSKNISTEVKKTKQEVKEEP